MKVSGKQYAAIVGASLGSLFAGSSFMHAILKPDMTIPSLPDKEGQVPASKEPKNVSV